MFTYQRAHGPIYSLIYIYICKSSYLQLDNHCKRLLTGYDRTIMTAQSVLTAMYPPTHEETPWNPEDSLFPWQPIPVHSVPKKVVIIRDDIKLYRRLLILNCEAGKSMPDIAVSTIWKNKL